MPPLWSQSAKSCHYSTHQPNKLKQIIQKERLQSCLSVITKDCNFTGNKLFQVLNMVIAKHSYKARVKAFGESAQHAKMEELKQLHAKDTMKLILASVLFKARKRTALKPIMTMKEKRIGEVTGYHCVNVRKQCGHIPKEESASLIIYLDSVFITLVINAKEECHIAEINLWASFYSQTTPTLFILYCMEEWLSSKQWLSYTPTKSLFPLTNKKMLYSTWNSWRQYMEGYRMNCCFIWNYGKSWSNEVLSITNTIPA